MNTQQTNHHSQIDPPVHLPPVQVKPPRSPHVPVPSTPFISTPISAANRRIAIAVDFSPESEFAVKWAVQNYIRPGDAVILLHVRPTSVLYGADWGATTPPAGTSPSTPQKQQLEEDFDNFTNTQAAKLAKPLVEGNVPFKIRIVKDHDMKERICLEVERLGLSAVIMGSRGFGASRRNAGKGRLGSVSDYCVKHCMCPVVVVRCSEEKTGGEEAEMAGEESDLHPVPEDEQEYHHDGDDHGN